MAQTTQIPERVSQCRAYLDNSRLSVTGELTLPDFSRPTQDMAGAGIAGPVAIPTRGNLESLRASFTSRVMTPEFLAAFSYGQHTLEFRAVIQGSDPNGSTQSLFSAFMRGVPVSTTNGAIQNGEEMGSSINFEVLDIRVDIDGITYVDISKLNNIVRIRNAAGVLVDENAVANAYLA